MIRRSFWVASDINIHVEHGMASQQVPPGRSLRASGQGRTITIQTKCVFHKLVFQGQANWKRAIKPRFSKYPFAGGMWPQSIDSIKCEQMKGNIPPLARTCFKLTWNSLGHARQSSPSWHYDRGTHDVVKPHLAKDDVFIKLQWWILTYLKNNLNSRFEDPTCEHL